MIELGNLAALRDIFISQGWTWLTAVCMMLFSLLHYPCATTLITMFRKPIVGVGRRSDFTAIGGGNPGHILCCARRTIIGGWFEGVKNSHNTIYDEQGSG